jgi:predicted aminopeptidase
MNEFLNRVRPVALVLLISTQLVACGFGYYWQATSGHLSIMQKRQPVEDIVADPGTPDAVRSKLQTASAAVEFAHRELLLPDNGSYQLYTDTGRRYVVWNVVATPEFSLQPRTWCFPVAGCVSYRGYFSEEHAIDFATGLAGGGDDTFVGGVAAYSTLGRFADPLLNTMMEFSDYQLAGLVFHELAHQLVYVKDDSKFNEGFASFVEEEGIYRWFRSRQDKDELCRYKLSSGRRQQVQELILQTRVQLESLYEQDIADEQKRAEKQELFNALRRTYADLNRSWANAVNFDHWFGESLNNAQLAALATYDDYVPAFAGLLHKDQGDLAAFFVRVKVLALLTDDQRRSEMQTLLQSEAEFTRDNGRRFDGTCPEGSAS